MAYDPTPGRYCCLNADCDHPRDQVFHGGGDDDDGETDRPAG